MEDGEIGFDELIQAAAIFDGGISNYESTYMYESTIGLNGPNTSVSAAMFCATAKSVQVIDQKQGGIIDEMIADKREAEYAKKLAKLEVRDAVKQ